MGIKHLFTLIVLLASPCAAQADAVPAARNAADGWALDDLLDRFAELRHTRSA